MKKTLFFQFMLTFIFTSVGTAKTIKYIELGINQSKFRNEESKSQFGPSFGVGLDYYPLKAFGGFVGSGLMYQNKRFLVEDRTWPTDFFPEFSSYVVTGDFKVNVSYLEIPMHIGYSVKINTFTHSSLFAGYSLSLPIINHTRVIENNVRLLNADEVGIYDFDYILVDENYMSMAKNCYVGFSLIYKRYAVLFTYTKALSITSGVSSKSIQDKIDNIKISFAVMF